jgi:photosystem II stability/assembly factor-like uncharacterized protein
VWAVTDQRLFVTLDGGDTWGDRTPPIEKGIAGTFTLDGSRGWVAGVGRAGDQVVVARTTDAGRHWGTAALPRRFRHSAAKRVSLSFIDGEHGWASLVGDLGTGPVVFQTVDGGAHWKALCGPCGTSGPSVLTGRNTGWSVDETARSLYRTSDGGRTWRYVPVPKGVPARGRRVLALPHFLSPRFGVIEGTYSRLTPAAVTSTTVIFFVTRDGGDSRTQTTPLSTHDFTRYVATGVPADVISREDWVVASPAGLYETQDGGKTWGLRLPNVSFDTVAEIDFATTRVGWALVTGGQCPPETEMCQPAPRLFRTIDGGVHWVRDDPGLVS